MAKSHKVVLERQTMLAGMTPSLRDGTYVFCSTDDAAITTAAVAGCLAIFREDEGTTLVLREADAIKFAFDVTMPMARIVRFCRKPCVMS